MMTHQAAAVMKDVTLYIFFFLLGDCELLQQGQVIKVTEYNNASLHFFFLPSPSLARILKNATPPASESR